jgi:hypothetical protein
VRAYRRSSPCPESVPLGRLLLAVAVVLASVPIGVPAASARTGSPGGTAVPARAAATAATTAALVPGAGQYVPLPAATTLVNNEALAAGAVRTLTVTGANGVPPVGQVSAVALSVMAYQPSANGNLTVYADEPRPTGYSSVNFTANHDIIGYEVTPVSATGQVRIYTTVATRLYVRLRGYYTSAAATTAGATFVPLAPRP